MAYREIFQQLGENYARVTIHTVYPTGSHVRGKKLKPSTKVQKQLNYRNACRRYEDLAHLNFTDRDLAVRLNYQHFIDDNGRNPSPAEALAMMQNFLRRLKRIYKKAGIELKYLYVTEIGKRTEKVHHHLLLTGGVARDVIEFAWGWGYANTQRLEFDEHGIRGLCRYMVKDPITNRRWNGSKNLTKPTDAGKNKNRYKNDYRITGRTVRYLTENREDAAYITKLYPGWVPSVTEDLYSFVEVGGENVDENTGELLPNRWGDYLTIYLYRPEAIPDKSHMGKSGIIRRRPRSIREGGAD